MVTCHGRDRHRATARLASMLAMAAALAACGGGDGAGSAANAGGGGGSTGTVADRGVSRTSLRVEASDGDGDALQYQWRATGGIMENRNSPETVWTVPDGPGLHFAYVVVSDGKGGHVEQQYAVATDALRTTAAAKPTVDHVAPAVTDFAGTPLRLRFVSADGDKTLFAVPGSAITAKRTVYLPDVQVQVMSGSEVVFTGTSDLGGEVSLPKLEANKTYSVMCSTGTGSIPVACRDELLSTTVATVVSVRPMLSSSRNLRLYGHVALADGGVCGLQNEFFGMQSAATVQLQQVDGTPLGAAVRVNRFGDYALDAAVAVKASLRLLVQCESYATTLNVPAPASAGVGYSSDAPIELSHRIPNSRPRVVKLVANGQDGNVRGEMVQLEAADAQSRSLPKPDQFLTYKGQDTRLSACMYYRSIGAAGGCDAQGNMTAPISFEDWKRQNRFKPYAGGNSEVSANYINKMDLNLVRRMVATQKSDDSIAFYVCNHPGPKGTTQTEVDQVLDTGLRDEKRVACVAMEWSPSPGVNGGNPLTKFLTFAPDGSLLPSINLDGRGEKYMPGSCVACHGGSQYNGRFPDKGNPSPFLGARFLPFDTGNYYFGSSYALTEPAQTEALYSLNQLVSETERTTADRTVPKPDTPTVNLIDRWYHSGTTRTLDKSYAPAQWSDETSQPGAVRFYREVIGSSCRTCHTALGAGFDVDRNPLFSAGNLKGHAGSRVCGGEAELVDNASMPNALVSRDRVAERVKADPELAVLMRRFLGCDAPNADPSYAKR